MGRDDDNWGWNGETEDNWSGGAGQRSHPGWGGASGSYGGSGQGWRRVGPQEGDPSGADQQDDNYGWGGPSHPSGPSSRGGYGQPGEPSRPGFGQPSGPSRAGYGQPSGPSRAGYGQPGPSSRGGYGQDGWGADPSANLPFDAGFRGVEGYAGYGQPSPSSQSWQATPSRPLEQQWGYAPGYAPQWGAPSQWPSPQMGELAAQPQGRSRRLWITLAVIAILLLAGTAGAVFAVQYFGPAGTINRFCGTLKAQSYSAVYSMLSKGYQGQITEDDFANDAVTLDRAEGSVLDCAMQSAGIGDNFHFGDSTVAFSLSIKRASAGTLAGILQLTNESGAWKINALDTSLLGVNLGAVQAANTFCTAMQSQAYSAAYAVLGKSQTAKLKESDYAQQGQWHDQVDGQVSICQVVGVSTSNSDTLASFSVSMTRSKLGKKQDTVSLDVENGAWKITTIGAQLQGTDIGGIGLTARFCSDLSHDNYTDLYGLLDTNFVGSSPEWYVAEVFDGQYNGVKFTGCTFDATTYKLSGTTATMATNFNLLQLSTSRTATAPATLKLVRYGNTWKVDDLTKS